MDRVKGKIAIVTGGARGLGEAMVRLLVAEGARVVIADILDAEGAALAAELGEAAIFQRHDVTSDASWQAVITGAEAAFGPVSVLVNNAGISSVKAISEYTEKDFRHVIDVNQISVFLALRAILPSMKRAGGGSIVNLSSVSGLIGKPHTLAYTASKFAVRGMTKVAALEYGEYNIRVNSVHPGPCRTGMVVASPDGELQPIVQQLLETIPARRLCEPQEIAQMVLALASDEMRYATGAEFVIDGGMSCE